jgi:hypothetical protein
VDPNFPLKLWDKLLPQATVTLNLLRKSRINPRMSAYAQLNGHFDFNRTPLAPPGTRIIAHEKPDQRASWSPHGLDGYYLGPELDHYRCYQVHITTQKRDSDCGHGGVLPSNTGNASHIVKRPCKHCSNGALPCASTPGSCGAV